MLKQGFFYLLSFSSFLLLVVFQSTVSDVLAVQEIPQQYDQSYISTTTTNHGTEKQLDVQTFGVYLFLSKVVSSDEMKVMGKTFKLWLNIDDRVSNSHLKRNHYLTYFSNNHSLIQFHRLNI